jgi:hypothetical protein
MEVSMHGLLDRPGKSDNQIQRTWNFGFFALPAAILIVLLAFLIARPTTSNWIADAVQAEFVDMYSAPDLAPTQIARPAMATRTVGIH